MTSMSGSRTLVSSVACPSNHVKKDEMSLEHARVDAEARDIHKQSAFNAVTRV